MISDSKARGEKEVFTLAASELQQGSRTLRCDLAAEFPLYVYAPHGAGRIAYSRSLPMLLSSPGVQTPLRVSPEGISFLLQAGVVPPPRTIFQDLFVVSVGDSVDVTADGSSVQLAFRHDFPFRNALRPGAEQPSASQILELLSQAVTARLHNTAPSYLFHSAGKDSNAVALALAEGGHQREVTSLSHRSKGAADESEIAGAMARKLGFRHVMLEEPRECGALHARAIHEYFEGLTIPTTDPVTLAYALYPLQLPTLKGANIIDGGGNDTYMGILPGRRENVGFAIAPVLAHFRSAVAAVMHSESILNPLTRVRSEWCGMSGFLYPEARAIYPPACDVRPHFIAEDLRRRGWDPIDFKTDLLSTVVASEMHIRKVRSTADTWGSRAIFPFASEAVALSLCSLPEQLLFDRHTRRNKVVLRSILKERLGLDSDALGKMSFVFDYWSVMLALLRSVENEVMTCPLWERAQMQRVLVRLVQHAHGGEGARRARELVHRVYLISAWFNNSRYVARSNGGAE